MMLADDISPARLLRSLLRGWYWILLGGVLGGVLGWCLSLLRVPQYEARAEISIGFDYARVAPLDDPVLTYVELRVRDLLLSDETAQSAFDALGAATEMADGPVDAQDLRRRIQLVQDGSRWMIIGRARTPEGSAAIANAWADTSLEAVEQAMIHAIRAAEFQTAIYRAGCRLAEDPNSPGQAIWRCEIPDDSDRPKNLPEELLQEARLSKGLLPAMSFSLLQRAEPPQAPVLWGRGGLILAVVLLGVWIAALGIIIRREGKTAIDGRADDGHRDS
jgi:uncharacterized protein involved in exopolysaccharide biosynthesis